MQLVRLLIPVCAGWVLCRTIGVFPATGITLMAAVCLPLSGAVLLRSSKPDKVSWKNLAAGWLLPWGFTVGRGKLPAITTVSAVFWALLFGLGVIGGRSEAVGTSTVPHSVLPGLINLLLILSWAIDGAVFFYCAGMLVQNAEVSRVPGSTIAKLSIIVGLLIGVSFTFWLLGKPTVALWIAGGPFLFFGLLYGAFCVILVTVGKKAKWN